MRVDDLLTTFLAKLLSSLKTSNRIAWLVIGAIFITIDNFFLAYQPDNLPAWLTTIVASITLLFANPNTSDTVAKVQSDAINKDSSIGVLIDAWLAGLVDSLKAKNLLVYSLIGSLLTGAKFVVISLDVSTATILVNILLDLSLLFTAPRTQKYLAK